jgi:ankyrin repeat protein
MTATRTGAVGAMRLLIERGATVDAREPEFQQTALMIAVRDDHAAAVGVLLAAGASVNAQTRKGPTPAFVPPCKGTGCGSEGVGINRGGLPDRGRRAEVKGGMTPLLYAARDGRLEPARRLVAAGADLELGDGNAIRPLLMAALNGQIAVARLLVERGANVNADDFWGRTPLWAAVEYRNLDMNNNDQDSPTDNGVDRPPFLDLIRLLIDKGANVNARTRELPPPRRWLYSLNDVSWVDFTGQTPFLRAALSADTTTMKLLVSRGADPNLPTLAGTTPLMAAAGVNWVVAQTYTESTQARLDAVALCLELGADVNAANSMGLTALLGAVNRGSNDIIELLAEAGRAARHQGQGRTHGAAVGRGCVPGRGGRGEEAGHHRAARAAGREAMSPTWLRVFRPCLRRRIVLAAALLLVAAGANVETQTAQQSAPATAPPGGRQATVDRYCVTCHSTRAKTGGLALEG